MSTHTVAAGDCAFHALALAANTEEYVAFSNDWNTVEVLVHSATQPVYVRCDGVAATVAGARCLAQPAGPSRRRFTITTDGNTSVRLITAGTALVSVTAE